MSSVRAMVMEVSSTFTAATRGAPPPASTSSMYALPTGRRGTVTLGMAPAAKMPKLWVGSSEPEITPLTITRWA